MRRSAIASTTELAFTDFRRKLFNWLMVGVLAALTAAAIFPLLNIFIYLIRQGASSVNLDFFIRLPKPEGETGGGMANAIAGTGVLIALASMIGIPWGIAAGVFLSEFSKTRLAGYLRLAIDLLAGVPSIVIGIFAYAVLVMPLHHFSALAGGVSLAIIMIPTVAKTTEEILKLVPTHIREAGLALGIPRWKVIVRVVLRGSVSGITTGVMLAVARAAGETAPLLFTALNNQFWPKGLDQPTASLPVQIYTYAISPYEDMHRQAWAGALLLVTFVFVLNLITRLAIGSTASTRD